MHEIIKEVKDSHLGYIQEELEKLIKLASTKDHKQVFVKDSIGTFNDKNSVSLFYITRTIRYITVLLTVLTSNLKEIKK